MGERQSEYPTIVLIYFVNPPTQYPIRLVLNGAASKQIEWHCKHYVGRGLMKRFENGAELAKEMKISPSKLKKTFDDYNRVSKSKNDPFGKKVRRNSVPFSCC